MDSQLAKNQARAAYERGRWKHALRFVPVAALIACTWLFVDIALIFVIPSVIALAALGVYARWHGRGLGAGVMPGVLVGAVPAVVILVARTFHGGALCSNCGITSPLVPFLVGALVGGGLVATRARVRWTTCASAGIFAALTFSWLCAWPAIAALAAAAVLGAGVVVVPVTLLRHGRVPS